METVRILDVNDEVCNAYLIFNGKHCWAQREDGVYIMPGYFMVLTAAEEEMLGMTEVSIG